MPSIPFWWLDNVSMPSKSELLLFIGEADEDDDNCQQGSVILAFQMLCKHSFGV